MIDLVFKVLGTGFALLLLLQIPLELRRMPLSMTRREFESPQALAPAQQPQTIVAYLGEADETTGLLEAVDAA